MHLLPPVSQGLAESTEREHARNTRAGEKRETREGADGNKRRAQAGSVGKEKERKGLRFFFTSRYSFRTRFPQ